MGRRSPLLPRSHMLNDTARQTKNRYDGHALVDGSVPIRDVASLLELREPPPCDFLTLAGFLLSQFQHIPKSGEHLTWDDWRFEVVDMDGRRGDKVLIERRHDAAEGG